MAPVYSPTPQISYNPGSGTVNFVPFLPPTNKEPEGELAATRHDSFASIGTKQAVWERTDTFLNLQFPMVPLSDMASWDAFYQYALQGGVFTYYPDSTDPTVSTQYTLEDTGWKYKRVAPGFYSFNVKIRQLASGSSTPGVTTLTRYALSPAPNGTITSFTVPPVLSPNGQLFQNGDLLTPGDDYSYGGSTITFFVAPLAGDILAYFQ